MGHDCDELIWQRAGVLAGPLGELLQAGEDCGLIECAQVYYPVLPFLMSTLTGDTLLTLRGTLGLLSQPFTPTQTF